MAAGAGPGGVAVSPDGGSVYVANPTSDNVCRQYDVGAGGALSPKSPATVAAGAILRGVAVSPDGGVYVTNRPDFAAGDRLPVRRWRGRGALPEDTGHGGRRRRAAGGGGEPGRRLGLRRQRRRQRVPVRRWRGRGALAQDTGHGGRGLRPVRVG